jgi:Fe-S-cluster containining protein
VKELTKNPFKKNTWAAKLKRTFTSILPADKDRKGQCIRCGACCKLPNYCWFLGINDKDEYFCKIHSLRPLNCRKYPRTKSELITCETCGFTFDQDDQADKDQLK